MLKWQIADCDESAKVVFKSTFPFWFVKSDQSEEEKIKWPLKMLALSLEHVHYRQDRMKCNKQL